MKVCSHEAGLTNLWAGDSPALPILVGREELASLVCAHALGRSLMIIGLEFPVVKTGQISAFA